MNEALDELRQRKMGKSMMSMNTPIARIMDWTKLVGILC